MADIARMDYNGKSKYFLISLSKKVLTTKKVTTGYCLKMCDHPKKFVSPRNCHPKVTKYTGYGALFPTQKTASKCVIIQKNLSPRKCYQNFTRYQRHNFPHKRLPQNVWSLKIFVSPGIFYFPENFSKSQKMW